MEEEKLNKTWSEVVSLVKTYEGIDPSQVNAFFSRLQPQAHSEGFLVITADNEFIRSWVEHNYAAHIKRALEEIDGVPTSILVAVDPNQPAPTPSGLAPTSTHGAQNHAHTDDSIASPRTDAVHTESYVDTTSSSDIRSREYGTAESLPSDMQADDDDIIDPVEADGLASMPGGTTVEMQRFGNGVRAEDTPTSHLTFENYVIGDSNRMAYTMAVSVAETPGKPQLNPLFIYGRSGCGKTHLLRAIQNHIQQTKPYLQTHYVDSAELLSDYMDASAAHDREKSSFKNFKTRYEDVDVLLIDDVQFLQGKKQTLDIVFQIFNKLTNSGKQVVLAADRAPKNIDIDDRYSSRFNSGGTFDIQAPEVETKLGVIKTFVEEYRRAENRDTFSLSNEIQLYIAENSNSNLRELKSAVTKVINQMELFKKDMTVDEVRRLLESHFSGGAFKRLTVADIQKEVEQFYHISHADLVGKKRNRNIMYARQVGIYLCRTLLDLPYNDIGKQFNRDHSTVMYSINCVEDRMKENREYEEEVNTLRQIVQEI